MDEKLRQKWSLGRRGGGRMIMFDIAEWIANLLVLGLGLCFWLITIFMIAMLLSMLKEWVNSNDK